MFAEFGALSFLRVQTFTTAIFESYELQFDSATAALQSAVLVALCLPVVYGELRLRRRLRFARVGRGAARRLVSIPFGRMKIPVVLTLTALIVISLGIPLVIIAYWLAVGQSLGLGVGSIWSALANSLFLTFTGAAVVVALALPLVLASTRYGGFLATWADRLPYAVHGLPGLVVALAYVFVSIHFIRPVYQTVAILLAAYGVLFLPLAQSALRASLELVPPRL
jgi:iron(III) transport system permease protein